MLTQEQLKAKIKLINDLYGDGLTRADFEKAFRELAQLVIRIESELTKKNLKLNQEVEALAQQIKSDNTSTIEELRRKITDKLATLKDGYTPVKGIDYEDGKDGISPDPKEIVKEVLKLTPPETAEETREKLESLQGEARLDKSAVKGLDEMEKSLQERIAKIPRGKGGTRRVPIFQATDFTSSVDGATTSFTLPRDTVRVFGVFSTQFPGVFNTTDWSFSGNTLTLNFTLQSGQSLIVFHENLFYA